MRREFLDPVTLSVIAALSMRSLLHLRKLLTLSGHLPYGISYLACESSCDIYLALYSTESQTNVNKNHEDVGSADPPPSFLDGFHV